MRVTRAGAVGPGVRIFALLGVWLAVAAWCSVPPAAAAQLTTKYPVVTVESGQTVTFELTVTGFDERVGLQVTDVPEGWQAVLRGGGFRIGAVYAASGSSPVVELEVSVPQDVQPGTYPVTVAAEAPSGDATLTMRLRVVAQAPGAFELTTEFAKLQGSSSDTFQFSLTLRNNTAEKGRFTLAARGPQGWTIDVSPSAEEQATTVTVEPGSTASLDVKADPPDNVRAGSYQIRVRVRGEGTTLTQQLTALVTGSAQLSLRTASEQLNASGSAGEQVALTLVVVNKGNAPLQGVEFSASPPSDWEVSFDPETLGAVPPGKAKQVTVHITPAGDAITGDYMVTLQASAGGSSESVDVRFTVETSGWWGLVGVLVIITAVVALLWVFKRFGRR